MRDVGDRDEGSLRKTMNGCEWNQMGKRDVGMRQVGDKECLGWE